MTALANLRALVNDLNLIASQGETPDGDGVTVNVQLWAERWADRIATLSPAELGGVEPIGFIAQSSLNALIACRNDAHNGYAEVWMRQTDTFTVPVYTTPRADEAVSVEKVWEALRPYVSPADASHARGILTAALTPPSPGAAK